MKELIIAALVALVSFLIGFVGSWLTDRFRKGGLS